MSAWMALAQALPVVANIFGGIAGNNALNNSKKAANRYYGQGIDALNAGNTQQRSDWQPYVLSGQAGLGGFQQSLNGGNQMDMPTQSGGFSFSQQDPSYQWRLNQGLGAIKASGVAHGAVGGGLGRALTDYAGNAASQEYGNQFNRFLQENNQKFGQQQQLWSNGMDDWKSHLAGWQNLAGMGQSATNAMTGLGAQYANGLNSTYRNWADAQTNFGDKKASIFGNMFSGGGQGLGGVMTQMGLGDK